MTQLLQITQHLSSYAIYLTLYINVIYKLLHFTNAMFDALMIILFVLRIYNM